jgi:peptidoglycan/LPS O-acetylase OafA/YrhL
MGSPDRLRRPARRSILFAMEFLNFVIILVAGWLVWRRPERERLAFGLLVVSFLLMALVFLIGTHTSLVPGVNL